MLSITKLSKSYKAIQVLNGISFEIAAGEVVGLIGGNGSGKTTLLNILAGIINATSGSFSISNKIRVSMLISRKGYFPDMTVADNLRIYGRLASSNMDKLAELSTMFKLTFINKRFKDLSAGEKQRVALVHTFLADSHLYLLDEPSNHLDAESYIALRRMILHQQKNHNRAFLITSHIFSDLEKLTDRVLIIKRGQIVINRETDKLLNEFSTLEEAYVHYTAN